MPKAKAKNLPLCFVLMPFGQKKDASGVTIDFDAIYRDLIRPAIVNAELQPIRADEEQTGGIIHKPMFERLILCDYAIADLTTANANVYYELGVRHGIRPWSTVLMFADGTRLPFDLGPMRGLPYRLDTTGKATKLTKTQKQLSELLAEAKKRSTDSPVFQLVRDMRPADVKHVKTDVFRDRVQYSEKVKEKLADARQADVRAVDKVRKKLGDISEVESGVLIDLLLSYRAVKAWDRMVDLVKAFPKPLRQSVLVQEQYGFALNRAGQGEKAERVLTKLIEERGPSSETYGILGRVYKDRWEAAAKAENAILATGLLDKAIDAYVKGFESDWRDAYPGINAVTLMELRDPPDPRRVELLPVVTYSVTRKVAGGEPDYWDHATLLELQVLANDRDAAATSLANALAVVREGWEPETTLRNIRLIRQAREKRGEAAEWITQIEDALATTQ